MPEMNFLESLQRKAPSVALQAYIIIFGLTISVSASSVSEFPKNQVSNFFMEPHYDETHPKYIFADHGRAAFLPCRVNPLATKYVSWIRSSDTQILTINSFLFISDLRFSSFYVKEIKSWTLQIKQARSKDSGKYECQIGTEPKTSIFVFLNVVVPKIEILGESEMYVKAGSSTKFTCVITSYAEEPANIFWYKDDVMIDENDKAEFTIRKQSLDFERMVGTLFIHHSMKNHSGNYSCSPTNQNSASVILHVLNGDHPATVQPGKASTSLNPKKWLINFTTGMGLAACLPVRAFIIKLTLFILIGQMLLSA